MDQTWTKIDQNLQKYEQNRNLKKKKTSENSRVFKYFYNFTNSQQKLMFLGSF